MYINEYAVYIVMTTTQCYNCNQEINEDVDGLCFGCDSALITQINRERGNQEEQARQEASERYNIVSEYIGGHN